MAESDAPRDLSRGIPAADLSEGAVVSGRVGEEDVILVARGADLFAIGANCTHYRGPLSQGLVVGDTIRCPWHHACFSLRTGEPLRAPALDPVSCWRVERHGDTVFVREKLGGGPPTGPVSPRRDWPESVVIIGGGAAGLAAAEMLRRSGYDRAVTMISADPDAPPDRPNLSKDYLAGSAKEDWIPLRPPEFYRDQQIELLLGASVASIDPGQHLVRVSGGRDYRFGAALIATGAEPVRLNLPGADGRAVHYLRSFADSRAIIASAAAARRAVVVGASFIGLEVAASLRARGLDVHVVAPERRPMERVLGPELGRWVQGVHESHGVVFHLERQVERFDDGRVVLTDGRALEADFAVIGVGVRPRVALAQQAHLAMDRGVLVNEYLQTSAPNIFAAGDVARWPDPHTGSAIRVEHWVVAERQGQAAARNMLGLRERFDAVPFFWSQHYDVPINYVGHAEAWDAIAIDGQVDAADCAVTFLRNGRRLAVATIGRDRQSLQAEAEMGSEVVSSRDS